MILGNRNKGNEKFVKSSQFIEVTLNKRHAILVLLSSLVILSLASCTQKTKPIQSTHQIKFANNEAFLDDKKITEYNYTWHIDSKGDYDAVKDSPAEYYTGDKPDEKDGIWIAHDIKYFPMIDKNKFYETYRNNDLEWDTNYENEKYKNFIFASLPRGNNGEIPENMMHSEEEAYKNPCLHITKEGTYELTGKWNGQIFVDLGKDSTTDPIKKINLIFNNIEVNCTVAPAINIYRTYECDNKWEERKEPTCDIDLTNAGANIIIKDNTKNYINGANVFRIHKAVLKKNGKEQKKAIKEDGAILSATSLNINGEKLNNGELYVNSTLEGISSDLHLSLNGGKIYINANDDGVNCSEENVSVLKINDGTLMINAGLLYQGDGIDSNGYIIINGGDIVSVADYLMDPGIDSTCETYINGGSLVALGEPASVDWAEIHMGENTDQSYIFKSFDEVQKEDTIISVIDEKGNEVYTFCEKDISHIKENARPFVGVLISNPKIKGTGMIGTKNIGE